MAAAGTVGVGLVGYGLAGRSFHAPFIDAVDGLRLAARSPPPIRIAERGRPRSTPAPTSWRGSTRCSAGPDIDLVVVATPNRFHVPIAISAALERPTRRRRQADGALDVAEAERLIEAASRADRLLSVYHNRRWDGDFLTIRRLLAEGSLGTIDSLESRFERVGRRRRRAGVRRPPRWAGRCATWGRTSSIRAWSCSGRHDASGPRWPGAARRPRSTTRPSWPSITPSGVQTRLWMSLIASRVGPASASAAWPAST